MSKKIVVVNAGPRKGWNTDTIISEAATDTMYQKLLDGYQRTLNSFVEPTEVFVCGDTLQVADYSKLDWEWSRFDPERKRQRHETVFPEECRKAFELGRAMV